MTQQWISVKERLPETTIVSFPPSRSEDVLVCQAHRYMYVAHRTEDGRWDDGDYKDDIPNVTHWMPLPPAPEGE